MMDPWLRDNLDQYDVAWSTPSSGASGSMPAGNGDLAINAWVEPDGDVLLLIGKSDAFDENSINLKLGRLRLRMSPPLDPAKGGFLQRLHLAAGEIRITAQTTAGEVSLNIRVDAHHPIIQIHSFGMAHGLVATVEIWRTANRPIKTQTGDLFRNLEGKDPFPTIISPDHLLQDADGAVTWCHHNAERADDGFDINLRLQGLATARAMLPHPLRGRTFGARLQGEGFVSGGERTLVSNQQRPEHLLHVVALTLHPATIDQWHQRLERLAEQVAALDRQDAQDAHHKWWEAFWSRGWVFIRSSQSPQGAQDVTRAYILQRFMNAAAGRGSLPIKFNGSLFTVGGDDDPDFRRWGGPGFWFMNQRLIYWPMLAAGDVDLMMPWLEMYRRMLPLQQLRTRIYYGHAGAHYPETITFWGTEVSAHYGWTPFEQRPTPEAECPYLRYYWSGGLELSLILHETWLYIEQDKFALDFLLPIATAVTTFYDLHYPRQPDGRLRFEPAQALETWHQAVNPLPEIAGLRYLLPRLLSMPDHLTTEEDRTRWRRMLEELPPLPVGAPDGRPQLLPAEQYDRKKNTENPELYAIFPYRLFGVGKPDLPLALEAFDRRLHIASSCWSQDEIQMALLGLSEACRDSLVARANPRNASDSRFPAFWNAFHDWVPDMDHGGVLQLALQYMLMQCEGSQIRLLPAWPSDWDCDFRLHAPQQTVVQGRIRDGQLQELHITPPSRRADVVMGQEAGRIR